VSSVPDSKSDGSPVAPNGFAEPGTEGTVDRLNEAPQTFPEFHRVLLRQICAAFEVPAEILQVADAASSRTSARQS